MLTVARTLQVLRTALQPTVSEYRAGLYLALAHVARRSTAAAVLEARGWGDAFSSGVDLLRFRPVDRRTPGCLRALTTIDELLLSWALSSGFVRSPSATVTAPQGIRVALRILAYREPELAVDEAHAWRALAEGCA